MNYVIYFSLGALLLSLIFDRRKTFKGLKITIKRFYKLLPILLFLIVVMTLAKYFITDKMIASTLQDKCLIVGIIIASMIGSISMIPGFIVFPLCGELLKHGVPYSVLSSFSASMMLVGIITFSIEKEYLGVKTSIIRNVIGLIIALIVSFVTAICYGELL